jgi:hypothetical protein
MKKCRTEKDLKNHPLFDKVFKEWQPHTYDGFEYIYWLWLKENGPTIQRLCDEFNSLTISKI